MKTWGRSQIHRAEKVQDFHDDMNLFPLDERDVEWPKHLVRRFFTLHCVPFACPLKAHVHSKDIARLRCCFEIVPAF